MPDRDPQNFYYLNRENRWPDFQLQGLVRDAEGILRLAPLPRLAAEPPPGLEALPVPDGPAGLAVAPDGSLFYTAPSPANPETAFVWRRDGCDPQGSPQPYLTLSGNSPGRLDRPRGLLVHAASNSLLVADSGNARLQAFDVQAGQVRAVWDLPPAPAGKTSTPWSLAADPDGNVYVADPGAGRVVKFRPTGGLQPSFWQNVQAGAAFSRPVAVAVALTGGRPVILVLDADTQTFYLLAPSGQVLGQVSPAQLQAPLALAACGEWLYLGDNGLRQVLQFHLDAALQVVYDGPAAGYSGPVAALACGPDEKLWVHPGGVLQPLVFERQGAFARQGLLWGGPFGTGLRTVDWFRYHAEVQGLGDGAHIRFYFHGGDDPSTAPLPPDLQGSSPFALSDWQPQALDVDDGRIPPAGGGLNVLPNAAYLWIGAWVTGEGYSSPELAQIWLNYDHQTYRQYLPAIFSAEPDQADLFDRLLGLFESFNTGVEDQIAHLERLFDPLGAPSGWLPWLAEWVALDLDERWSEARQRLAIRQALGLYARRGTASGLREALQFYTGIQAHVAEPIRNIHWWLLPGEDASPPEQEAALLGFTTRLAPVEADGAVLGGSAALDRSDLIDAEDYGAPLFNELAHQFTVEVYRGQVSTAAALARVQDVIEREKPAHTLHQLCLIEPLFRIGFQARLGIDTVVAGEPEPGQPAPGGSPPGTTLGGDPPGQLGIRSQVGQTTRLTGTP